MINRPLIPGLCGLMLLACAAPVRSAQKFPDYPLRPPSDYIVSALQDGMSVGIEPVISVQDQLKYFHAAISPKGFLPVLVVIHNRSKLDSLLLDKGGISYGLGNSDEPAPKENTAGQKTAIATTALIPFIGPFVAMGMAEDASEVKQNLVLRELQSGTLSPGETMHGFLYIPIPKKGPRPKIHIQFPVAWAGSDRTSVLHLEF